ncbi:UNKNOWN [Stylonychia lemnae]|uniref:Uncharacterized protein n=1 Tax=Stylonychia lemnae TaxID=5949 RepID=A0A078ASI4_STYLE|nr:UNKNOWN [Stylonychia lemnae]|eukprot:CDW84956.1 UNKNOWN [Stylonychia lemnae]
MGNSSICCQDNLEFDITDAQYIYSKQSSQMSLPTQASNSQVMEKDGLYHNQKFNQRHIQQIHQMKIEIEQEKIKSNRNHIDLIKNMHLTQRNSLELDQLKYNEANTLPYLQNLSSMKSSCLSNNSLSKNSSCLSERNLKNVVSNTSPFKTQKIYDQVDFGKINQKSQNPFTIRISKFSDHSRSEKNSNSVMYDSDSDQSRASQTNAKKKILNNMQRRDIEVQYLDISDCSSDTISELDSEFSDNHLNKKDTLYTINFKDPAFNNKFSNYKINQYIGADFEIASSDIIEEDPNEDKYPQIDLIQKRIRLSSEQFNDNALRIQIDQIQAINSYTQNFSLGQANVQRKYQQKQQDASVIKKQLLKKLLNKRISRKSQRIRKQKKIYECEEVKAQV